MANNAPTSGPILPWQPGGAKALPQSDEAMKQGETDGTVLVGKEAPYFPPEGSSEELQKEHRALYFLHLDLLKDLTATDLVEGERKSLIDSVLAYKMRAMAFEQTLRKNALLSLRDALGLKLLDKKEFEGFLEELYEPLASALPIDVDKRFSKEQQEVLIKDHARLAESHDVVVFKIGGALTNLRNGKEIKESEIKSLNVKVVDFMRMKWRRQAEVHGKKIDPPAYVTYAAIAISEVAEETGEGLWRFGDKMSFPGLKQMDAFIDTKLDAAGRKVSQELAKRGIKSPPQMKAAIETFNKMPFGRECLRKLLTVESPVTVAIFLHYLHTSNDKLKAAMNFASFMTMSAVSSELLEIMQRSLISGFDRYIQWKRQSLGLKRWKPSVRSRRAMLLMKKLPKQPAVMFTAAILLMVGAFPYVDKYFLTPVNEAIPDGELKQAAQTLLHRADDWTVGLVADAAEATGAPQVFGMMRIDPQLDQYRLLSTETTRELWDPLMTSADFKYDLDDWNAYIRQEAKFARADHNPLAEKLILLESVDSRTIWSQRRAGVDLRPSVVAGVQTQDALEKALRGHEQQCPLLEYERINLMEIATADHDFWDEQLDSVYTKERNDRALEFMIDNKSTTAGRVHKFVKSLSKEHPTRVLWDQCLAKARATAALTTLYRHNVDYNKKQWLEDSRGISDFAHQGLIEEIAYSLKRERVLKYAPEGRKNDSKASAHAYDLVNCMRIIEEEPGIVEGTIQTTGDLLTLQPLRGRDLGRELFPHSNPDGSDNRLLQRNSLSMIAQAAAAQLSVDQMNEAFSGIRAVVLENRIVSIPEMRAMEKVLTDTMSESNQSFFSEAGDEYSQRLHMPEYVHVFTSIESSPGERHAEDILARTFQHQETHHSKHFDIALHQFIQPSTGGAVLTETRIDCRGNDPAKWTVDIRRSSYSEGFGTESQVNNLGSSEDIPFLEWSKQHPELLQDAQGKSTELSMAMRSIIAEHREQARVQEEESQAAEGERQEQRERAETMQDRWVAVGGVYQMRYGDKMVTYSPHQEDTVRSGLPMRGTTFWRQPQTSFNYTVEQPNGSKKDFRLKNISGLMEESIAEGERRGLRTLLTTPIEGEDELTLSRIIEITPSQVYTPSDSDPHDLGYILGWKPKFYGVELLKALLPEYQRANPESRRVFLNDFINKIIEEDGISKRASKRIPKYFREHRSQYQ
jgi:hypothetical protein